MADKPLADDDKDVIIPIVHEEVYADAAPVVTGTVRVTKQVHSHDELVNQELRKSHVEVKRVPTHRVVDGPQAVQRVGDTLIIPVVSEVLRIERDWVITEEIHITERLEKEIVEQSVTVNHEQAHIERLDASGNVVGTDNSLDASRSLNDASRSVNSDRAVAARANAAGPELSGAASDVVLEETRSSPESILARRNQAATPAAASDAARPRSIVARRTGRKKGE